MNNAVGGAWQDFVDAYHLTPRRSFVTRTAAGAAVFSPPLVVCVDGVLYGLERATENRTTRRVVLTLVNSAGGMTVRDCGMDDTTFMLYPESDWDAFRDEPTPTTKPAAKPKKAIPEVCPKCGDAGEWRMLALVCRRGHGVFQG